MRRHRCTTLLWCYARIATGLTPFNIKGDWDHPSFKKIISHLVKRYASSYPWFLCEWKTALKMEIWHGFFFVLKLMLHKTSGLGLQWSPPTRHIHKNKKNLNHVTCPDRSSSLLVHLAALSSRITTSQSVFVPARPPWLRPGEICAFNKRWRWNPGAWWEAIHTAGMHLNISYDWPHPVSFSPSEPDPHTHQPHTLVTISNTLKENSSPIKVQTRQIRNTIGTLSLPLEGRREIKTFFI